MASASNDVSDHLQSHIISASNPLSPVVLQQIANAGILDEISNHSGAVRHHIYWHGNRDEADNTLREPVLFFIYQTTRHGPQNGFRLCLVHRGFHIASATKSEDDVEDDIDRLEKEIPQGHMEVVLLGPEPTASGGCEEDEACGPTNSGEETLNPVKERVSDGTVGSAGHADGVKDETDGDPYTGCCQEIRDPEDVGRGD